MMVDAFSTSFVRAALADPYVPCPRCRGRRFVSAITRMGDGWQPTISEDFECPLCHATGEAERELADEWTREQAEHSNG